MSNPGGSAANNTAELTAFCFWQAAPICNYDCTTGTPNSPVLLDIYQLGRPDLLAGDSAWKKDRGGKADPSALRDFDLDMMGVSKWEWVGPKSALLVYGLEKPVEADGSVLFGGRTFGQNWKNGYDALKKLDKDGDAKISGQELDVLWLWLDSNTDAKISPEEIFPASSFVTDINTGYQQDEGGNTWQDQGATLINGTKIKTWDWWSFPGE